MTSSTLEDLLVQTHVLSSVQLAVARRDAEVRRRPLASAVVDLGLIDETRFARWTAETSGLRILHPISDEAASALAGRIPAPLARKHGFLPVAVDGDELTVATIDPFDRGALDLLHISTGMKVRPVIGHHGEVTRLLDKYYPESPSLSAEDSFGSSTQIFTPRPAVEPESQLDRIEANLAALTTLVEALDRKVASLDAMLARTIPRS